MEIKEKGSTFFLVMGVYMMVGRGREKIIGLEEKNTNV